MGRGFARIGAVLIVSLTGCLPGYLSNKHAGHEGYYAPPITSIDADGQTMRLKDYKGKVILLSFWHSNCPPCRKLVPHERALVQKFADRSFVLLGVNADESPFELKRIQEKEKLTWPSFWDGADGAIAAVWGVEQYPTLFLIDRENIVRWRYEGLPPEGMIEQKIEEALRRPPPKESTPSEF